VGFEKLDGKIFGWHLHETFCQWTPGKIAAE
jgi:hypothetical protein